jgi:predicted nucleic acid-binding protein
MAVLLDTGPWVALLSRNDSHHRWAVEQFRQLKPPLLSCEAVVAETCFLLSRSSFDPALALQFVERGVVQLPFVLQDQIQAVHNLFKRYENVPASLADASLVRLAEISDAPTLLTTDSDFHVYRRHGRQSIPLITP